MNDITENPFLGEATRLKVDPFITTASGLRFHFARFKEEDIRLEDIATHLSNIYRWVGASKHKISIASHSIAMAEHAMRCDMPDLPAFLKGIFKASADEQKTMDVRKMFARALLLHDAEEYVTNDLASPLKVFFPKFVEYGDYVRRVMHKKYNLSYDMWHPLVKEWDKRMLYTEAEFGMPGGRTAICAEDEVPNTVPTFDLCVANYTNKPSYEVANQFLHLFARTL